MRTADLNPDAIVHAACRGAFPMDSEDADEVGFYVANPRTVLPVGAVRVPRSVARALRHGHFSFRVDSDFPGVVAGCAAPRPGQGVWLSARLAAAYQQLHERGVAHSLEVWVDGRLAAGMFGLAIEGLITSESMFHRVPNAGSALIVLASAHLGTRGYALWDIQMMSPHVARFGAEELSVRQYEGRLSEALSRRCTLLD